MTVVEKFHSEDNVKLNQREGMVMVGVFVPISRP